MDLGAAHDRPAAWHTSVHDGAHRLYPTQDIDRHPSVADERSGFAGRREPIPGADNRAGLDHRHGQYRGRGYGGIPWRAGRGAVVLADRCVRHCDQIRGEPDCRQIPRADKGWTDAGRCHVRAGARPAYEVAGRGVRRVCHAGLVRHRLRHADQRDLRDHPGQQPDLHPAAGHWHRIRGDYGGGHHRRHQIDRGRV